jgi:hypothetical protein
VEIKALIIQMDVKREEAKGQFRDGQGRLTLPNGGVYQGGYKNGEFHGQGKMISPEGQVEYDGEWRNGKQMTDN